MVVDSGRGPPKLPTSIKRRRLRDLAEELSFFSRWVEISFEKLRGSRRNTVKVLGILNYVSINVF
jgi:hypothetical protein